VGARSRGALGSNKLAKIDTADRLTAKQSGGAEGYEDLQKYNTIDTGGKSSKASRTG